MPSAFSGIEIASRALRTAQEVVDVAGHNIANVNTPGYSRQSAALAATPPDNGVGVLTLGAAGQIGTGVELAAVTRVRDQYLDRRLLQAVGDQGSANQLRDALSRIQNAYLEPGANGISTQITAFFNSFQQLSVQPESVSQRFVVKSQADTLTRQFNQLSAELTRIDSDYASKLTNVISSANDLAGQIARLSGQIQQQVALSQHPNDLQDRRDALIKQLGEMVGVDVTEEADSTGKQTGNVNVDVGGYALIRGNTVNPLPLTTGAVANLPAFASGGEMFPIKGGQVAALITTRMLVAGYKTDLDRLANALVTRVNAVHAGGYGLDGLTGRPFFAGADAATIRVDSAIDSNLNSIAAASPPAAGQPVSPGNGNNARAIAGLASAPSVSSFTFSEYYNSRVVAVGADALRFQRDADTQEQQVRQLETMRGQVSGVSLDEEMTHMIQFQRSYQAAARLMSTMDTMLDTLINRVGR